MATLILRNPLIALGDIDMSADLNQVQLDYGADEVDDTRFGMNTHQLAPDPLKTLSASVNGRFNAVEGGLDGRLFNNLAAEGAFSLTPTRNDGDTAYLSKLVRLSYSPGASIGERLSFEANLAGTTDLVRGQLLGDVQATASGTGTALQLGTLSSSQTLYAALHVVAVSGTSPTLDVKIESDDASGFASPVDRITFAQATGRTSEWASAAGAIADDWFRINYTIGGTNPDFTFIVTAGIL